MVVQLVVMNVVVVISVVFLYTSKHEKK